jgi:DNA-binding HxlR family transcriptional regulator
MERVPYQDQGQRARTSYHLTPSGTELAIAIGALQQWGDQHPFAANTARLRRTAPATDGR